MAITVEDGSGVANADAYVSVAYADAYFAARLNQLWSNLTEEQKDAAIIQATDYIDIRWGARLKGCRVSPDQPLQFPRDIYDGKMPAALLKATCEYAVRASQGPLAPDPEVDESGYQVTGKTEKVGPIEEKTTYAYEGSGSNMMRFIPYPYADGLMRPLINDGQGRVIRN